MENSFIVTLKILAKTQKGCGYPFAENDPAKFHGIGKFDSSTGKKLGAKVKTYSDIFGETLVSLAETNPRICAITAAMPGGTGLLKFMSRFPERFFDVGIAEEHAVSMAGGLAKQGMVPVVALYSTFLQRAYDQLMQDIAMLNLHVVFAIDRAGLVGDDGPTHHGVFDVGFLRQIPGMLILNPASLAESQAMLSWAVSEYDGPVAIRYPRGTEGGYTASDWDGSKPAAVKCHRNGADVALITYGSMLDTVLEAADALSKMGIEASVHRLMNLSDLNGQEILSSISGCKNIVVVEEVCTGSGIRETLAWNIHQQVSECAVYGMDLGADFVPHGAQKLLYQHCGLDCASIVHYVEEVLANEN